MIKDLSIEEEFSRLTALIGEKGRSKMLWHLLDGKAYTALELAIVADVSKQSCSNHLKKLVGEKILVVEKQGRHKYFKLMNDDVAKALEGLAFLTTHNIQSVQASNSNPTGIKYARSCYDHLAGYLGVCLERALLNQGFIIKSSDEYQCTSKGMQLFADLNIDIVDLQKKKRKFAYPCLDWSERRHHIGGALGAALLEHMFAKDYLRRIANTRELILTAKGQKALEDQFGLRL